MAEAPGAAATLGIVAGSGPLPARLARVCAESGRDVFVLMLEGQADDPALEAFPHRRVRFGEALVAREALKAAGVEEVVFVGNVRRPSLATIRPDWLAAKVMAKLGLRALGDDSLMRAIASAFEDEGFRVIGPDSVLRELLAAPGVVGRLQPDAVALADIARGLEVARALGRADAGQGVVVQQGVVLAIEAAEGTDAMLIRAQSLRHEGPGGVLVKARKPQQDRRLDLPSIGVRTVHAAAAAGLRGIAVEAGGALVVDRGAVAAAADAAGLFVIALVGEDGTRA